MRAIKVTYRAIFQQPIGVLNPMGMKIGGNLPVELFERAGKWYLRELSTLKKNVYERLGFFVSANHCKENIKHSFESQVADWQIWGTPTGASEPRQLEPWELHTLNTGQVLLKMSEDFTHIHQQNAPTDKHHGQTACGIVLKTEFFISTKAHIEPSCPTCAEVYRREYAGR